MDINISELDSVDCDPVSLEYVKDVDVYAETIEYDAHVECDFPIILDTTLNIRDPETIECNPLILADAMMLTEKRLFGEHDYVKDVNVGI